MARQWILTNQDGFEESLEYQHSLPVRSGKDLGPNEVLVKLEAASINYKELVMAGQSGFAAPIKRNVVPSSDGAGIVLATGSSVAEFQVGDRVVTFQAPEMARTRGDDAQFGIGDADASLGQGADGTLCTHGVFDEKALVHAPETLSMLQAATLTCTYVSAWNILFGKAGLSVSPGQWILVQGTGGLSVAVLQLAVHAEVNVVATTSSEERAERLRALGAKAVLNYRETAKWGQEAKKLTPGCRGFDMVIDVGGDATLPQSLAATRLDGVVAVSGAVGSSAETVPMLQALWSSCIIRGSLLGTRNQMKELVRFIDDKEVAIAVDDEVFELKDAKKAYRKLHERKHFAKVVIQIDHGQ